MESLEVIPSWPLNGTQVRNSDSRGHGVHDVHPVNQLWLIFYFLDKILLCNSGNFLTEQTGLIFIEISLSLPPE